MKFRKMFPVAAAFVLVGLTLFSPHTATAQQAATAIKRTVLDKHDLSVPGREGVLVQVEFEPGAAEPKHTHPGDVFAYLQEGSVSLWQEGQPTTQVKTGEVFFVPAGRVHSAKNDGTNKAKAIVTFFVEKDKPITTPVK